MTEQNLAWQAQDFLATSDTTWKRVQFQIYRGTILPNDPVVLAWMSWVESLRPYASGNVDGSLPIEPPRPA